MATVLLADDNGAVRHALAMLLRGAGHAVMEADGGRRAVQVAAAESPDVVVADLNMPDMGGVEMISRIREVAPDARVVGLSGGGMHQSPQATLGLAIQAGADEALAKPVGNEALLGAVRAESPGR